MGSTTRWDVSMDTYVRCSGQFQGCGNGVRERGDIYRWRILHFSAEKLGVRANVVLFEHRGRPR